MVDVLAFYVVFFPPVYAQYYYVYWVHPIYLIFLTFLLNISEPLTYSVFICSIGSTHIHNDNSLTEI